MTVKRTIGRFTVIPIEVENSDGVPAPRLPALRVQVGERWIRLMGKFETEAQIEAALAKMEAGQ